MIYLLSLPRFNETLYTHSKNFILSSSYDLKFPFQIPINWIINWTSLNLNTFWTNEPATKRIAC